jgi:hypothetical protein
MTEKIKIHDYITPIKEIVIGKSPDREKHLHKLIYRARKINARHLQKGCTVDQTVARLLDRSWQPKVKAFDPDEWRSISELFWKRTSSILGPVSPPEIILFPGFNTMNGRVYKIDGKPVIGCSPDFPHSTGKNLMVLIAHEYAHLARWRETGIPSDNVPVYANIYEEGWAIWLSIKLLPDFNLSRIFMSNLHRTIDMPDPKGGYFAWCRKNLHTIASEAQKALVSKSAKDLGRFFQCQRFRRSDTPIRTGYYLGYRLLEMLSKRMTPRQLFREKPTSGKIFGWLGELIGREW